MHISGVWQEVNVAAVLAVEFRPVSFHRGDRSGMERPHRDQCDAGRSGPVR